MQEHEKQPEADREPGSGAEETANAQEQPLPEAGDASSSESGRSEAPAGEAPGGGSEEKPDVSPAPVPAPTPVSVPAETRPLRSRIGTLAVPLGALVLGAALFAAGSWTASLIDDDLRPLEERIDALEERVGQVDDRTGEIRQLLASSDHAGNDKPAGDPAAATSQASSDDPTWGPEDAAVVIVEFSDFQCPYCRRFATETLPSIRDAYGDDVRFVYRDFPISALHPFAEKAAEAAQCAQDQGRFWEYHDILFANQDALTASDLKSYAGQAGMDVGTFIDCLDSGTHQREVLQDLQDGQRAGVTGTPGFIVNGVLISGAQPFAVFQQVIDRLLQAEQ